MSKILIINASARQERSVSRQMTHIFVEKWKKMFPDDTFTYRNVGQDLIPHVDEKWIAAAFTPEELRSAENHKSLELSNILTSELKEADYIVLGTPMYNWSIPSALKAYIDQIIRVNITVTVHKETPETPYGGLLSTKKVFLLMIRGNAGYEKGEALSHLDFQKEYLKTVFGIMGVKDIQYIAVNGIDLRNNIFESAQKEIDAMIKNNVSNEISCS